jgi:hypothetical protein
MTTVMAYHDVKDVKHWLASKLRGEVFASIGVTSIRTFVAPNVQNRVGIVMDVPDMDRLRAFMQSHEAAEAMAADGVLPDTVVLFVQS